MNKADSCFVFKETLSDVQSEAEKLLNDADLTARKEELLTCFGCGLKCKDIKKCGGCKLAKYCSQVKRVKLS